jgi:LysR family glycine cleavage system transcriptional activator
MLGNLSARHLELIRFHAEPGNVGPTCRPPAIVAMADAGIVVPAIDTIANAAAHAAAVKVFGCLVHVARPLSSWLSNATAFAFMIESVLLLMRSANVSISSANAISVRKNRTECYSKIFSICEFFFHMDWSHLPSLNSLRAFSVLAETNSYSAAARQLNVTHAAVRQQVKALESHLGTALAYRHGRGIRLTPEGTALARSLGDGFATIHRGVDALMDRQDERPVQITTSPAFAVEWLMPRIPEFQRQHPEITLMLNPTADVITLKPGGTDVAVRYIDSYRAQESIPALLLSDMVVVGAPALLGERSFDEPSALLDLPWMQELGTNEAVQWFNRRGVTLNRPLIISQMPGNLIMQALRRGGGISYTARAFFQDDIDAGRMRVLHSEPASGIYYLETADGPLRPAVKTFLAWLKSKAQTVTV